MCVDVLWCLTSDAGSTPATSTSLRLSEAINEDCSGVFRFIGRSRANKAKVNFALAGQKN